MYAGGGPSDRVAATRCNLSSHLEVLLVYSCCSYDVIPHPGNPQERALERPRASHALVVVGRGAVTARPEVR
jgi:hypothetical protein